MEKYLRKCLDSLIVNDENMKLLEALVINDGSKDSSSQIAHEYELKYPDTYRVIDKENGNYGSCINRGLKEATGRFVKILDADDWFDTHALHEVLTYLSGLEDSSLDLLLTLRRDIFEGESHIRKTTPFPLQSYTVFPFSKLVESGDFYKCFQMHWIIYRTEMLKKSNYIQTEGISYTDTEWLFLPMRNVTNFAYVPVYLYNYLMGRPGQTVDPAVQAKTADQLMKILRRLVIEFNSIEGQIDVMHFTFMQENLLRILYELYKRVLLFPNTPSERLIEFDKWLKKNEQLYNLLFDIKGPYNIPLVRLWRKNTYRIPFYIYPFYRIGKQYSKLKIIIANAFHN